MLNIARSLLGVGTSKSDLPAEPSDPIVPHSELTDIQQEKLFVTGNTDKHYGKENYLQGGK